MENIRKFLEGEMGMDEFLPLLKSDELLRNDIRSLIPPNATNNREHGLWKVYSYSTAQKYNFDMLQLLEQMFRLDSSIPDNLNIFGTLRRVYCYFHPDTVCTSVYHDSFHLYLDATGEYFDGPEVNAQVMKIIEKALELNTASKRKQYAKQAIRESFHIDKGCPYPRWIQGAEWPMGEFSPMRYISRKRKGECVQYLFEDVDTGVKKIVEQYY